MDKNADPDSLLNKVLNSVTFTNKEVQKTLLEFLYTSAKYGKTLHEIDIALDFFHREDTFQPGEDTIVRVSIYKLRALLEKYYQNEGAQDGYIFDLPKGNYTLKYIKKGDKKIRPIQKSKNKRLLYYILFASIAVNLLFLYKMNTSFGLKQNPIWTDYLKSKYPVCITLGDPFFFKVIQDSTDEGIVVRDITINSKEDIQRSNAAKYLKSGLDIKPLDYPYLSINNIRPLPDIIKVFAKSDIDVNLHTLSESDIEDVKNSNQVLIGNINSFGFFEKFLEKTSISIHTNPREIIINNQTDSLVLSVPEKINGYYADYAFLVKVPSVNNTIITLIGDFHASGIMGLSHFITNESTLLKLNNDITEKYGSFPDFFEMIVKVTSYNRYDFNTEVIYFNPLN